MPIVHNCRYYPWENADCIFGIVRQCLLCGLLVPLGKRRFHIWHCVLMPVMHIWCPSNPGFRLVDNAKNAENAFYAGVLQCHFCRQCHLCTWDTLYSKLDCHPVNFHFPHIWHCLWHYVGLKYPLYIIFHFNQGRPAQFFMVCDPLGYEVLKPHPKEGKGSLRLSVYCHCPMAVLRECTLSLSPAASSAVLARPRVRK